LLASRADKREQEQAIARLRAEFDPSARPRHQDELQYQR